MKLFILTVLATASCSGQPNFRYKQDVMETSATTIPGGGYYSQGIDSNFIDGYGGGSFLGGGAGFGGGQGIGINQGIGISQGIGGGRLNRGGYHGGYIGGGSQSFGGGGLGAGGIGLSQGGIGLSQGGIGLSQGGIGLSQGGIGLSQGGIGLGQGGIGLHQGGIGIGQGGIGLSQGGIGLSGGGIGLSGGAGIGIGSGVGIGSGGLGGIRGGGIGFGAGGIGGGVGGGYIGGGYVHPHGAEVIDKSVYSGGKKNLEDGSFENASGKKAVQINQGENGYNQGKVGLQSSKGDAAFFNDQEAAKKVVEDGKAYQGGQQFNQQGLNANEKKLEAGHKKGHVVKGFKSSHHKDETGKTEEFYDEAHDEGDNFNFQGQNGKFGEGSQASFKGGHDDRFYNADERNKKGHYDGQQFVNRNNADQGQYGQNKFIGNGQVYGVNNGVDQQSLLGHQESNRFYKHYPYHSFY